jgi:hypothetical protein
MPQRVTSPKASAITCADIFDSPATRSTNAIGTSSIWAPALSAR